MLIYMLFILPLTQTGWERHFIMKTEMSDVCGNILSQVINLASFPLSCLENIAQGQCLICQKTVLFRHVVTRDQNSHQSQHRKGTVSPRHCVNLLMQEKAQKNRWACLFSNKALFFPGLSFLKCPLRGDIVFRDPVVRPICPVNIGQLGNNAQYKFEQGGIPEGLCSSWNAKTSPQASTFDTWSLFGELVQEMRPTWLKDVTWGEFFRVMAWCSSGPDLSGFMGI